MNRNNKIVRLVGVLFIVQMATAVSSYSIILDPLLYQANYLDALAGSPTLVTIAMLLDLLCGASVFAIAVLLFPILKQFSERIALWYTGQRLTELMSFIISGFLLLTILKIGQKIGSVSGTEAEYLESIAIYLRTARGNLQNIMLLVYCLGAWSFYGLLFYSRLIPRWLSSWGLLGVTLLFVEISHNIFGSSLGGMMIMMPLGLNEIFLGFWLIIKGFNADKINQLKNEVS